MMYTMLRGPCKTLHGPRFTKMPQRGLEPPRPKAQALNLLRMPIPPLGHLQDELYAKWQSCQTRWWPDGVSLSDPVATLPRPVSDYNTDMKMMRIPIYPSGEVIFPGQLIRLSDEAWGMEQMLSYCREHRQPIGLVLASGPQGHTLADVGTLAYLMDGFPDSNPDMLDTLVVAQYRFRMLQIHQDQAFLEATVQLWPWVEEPRPDWRTVEQLGIYLRRFVAALSNVLPPILLPEILSPTASTLGVLGAALLQLPAKDKQRLLELPTAQTLLVTVLDYMRIYVPIAERLAKIPAEVPVLDEYISLN